MADQSPQVLFLDLHTSNSSLHESAILELEANPHYNVDRCTSLGRAQERLNQKQHFYNVLLMWFDETNKSNWSDHRRQLTATEQDIEVIIIFDEDEERESRHVLAENDYVFVCPFNIDVLTCYIEAVAENNFYERNSTFVQEVMEQVSTIYKIEDLLNVIVSKIKDELECTHCTFLIRRDPEDTGENNVQPYVETWIPLRDDADVRRFYEGDGSIAGKVLATKSSVIINDTNNDTEVSPQFPKFSTNPDASRSMLVVPVLVDGRVLGIISADVQELNYFKPHNQDLVELLAYQAATLIERTWVLQKSHAINTEINNIDTQNGINAVLQTIIRSAMEITNATSAVIHLIHEYGNNEYRYGISYNEPARFLHPKPRFYSTESLTRRVIESKKIMSFPRSELQSALTTKGVRAVIGAPLYAENKIIGVLFLNSTTKDVFNPLERFSLELFASQASITLKNAQRLLLADALKPLARASEAVLQRNERLENTFSKIAEQACKLVGAKYSHVALKSTEDANEFIQFVATFPASHLKNLNELVGGKINLSNGSTQLNGKLGISGLAAKNRTPVLIRNVDNDVHGKDVNYPPIEELKRNYIQYLDDTKSELAVPIIDANDNVVGVINLEHEKAYALSDRHIEVMNLFATQVAIAMELHESLHHTEKELNTLKTEFNKSQTKLTNVIDAGLDDARNRSRRYYWFSFTISLIGTSIIFLSAILALNGLTPLGVVGTLTGIIVQIAGVLSFTRTDLADKRLDQYNSQRFKVDQISILLNLAQQLGKSEQSQSKYEIIKSASDYWFNTDNANYH